jgi:ATP-dependent Lon protease
MATAMLSAVAQIPIRADLAMTGEITLRGRVLAIGGLKEKLLAAKAAGIHKVLVPSENRPDIEEMDAEVLEDITIVYVSEMPEVLSEAFTK